MVEKLLPTSVALLAKVNVNKGVVFRPDGLLNERHTGLFWISASFFDIAFGAGTDNIFPNGLATHTSRDNMVE